MKLLAVVFVLAVSCPLARAQDNFPVIPAWEAMVTFYSFRMTGGWSPGNGFPSEESIATGAISSAKAFPPSSRAFLKSIQTRKWDKDDVETLREYRRFFAGNWEPALKSWLDHSSDLIKAKGENPASLLQKATPDAEVLRQIQDFCTKTLRTIGAPPQFPDVPFTHWAEPAVQGLRDAGIITGYPSGGGDLPTFSPAPQLPATHKR